MGKPLTGTIMSITVSNPTWGGDQLYMGGAITVPLVVSKLMGFFSGTPSTVAQAESFQALIRAGADSINHPGSFGRSLRGYGGDDNIDDGAGNSILIGDAGNDTLSGGAGNDILRGGVGADSLDGGAGWDVGVWSDLLSAVQVTRVAGNLRVATATGVDTFANGEEIQLTKFGDRVNLGIASATGMVVHGGAGNDSIAGLVGSDTFYGDAGNDVITRGRVGDGGLGIDLVASDFLAFWSADTGGHRVRVDLGLTTNRVIDDGFGNIEDSRATRGVYGSTWGDIVKGRIYFADELFGNDGNDTLAGFGGDDTVFGGAGDDLVTGDAGNDVLGGDAGSDKVYGGLGIDELSLWDSTVLHGARVDLTLNLALDDGYGSQDTLGGIERVSGTDFGDTLVGSALDNILWGIAGNDRLDARFGNDELYGGDGDDTLFGGAGNDRFEGGAGGDVLQGDSGNDLFFGDVGSDTINGGDGIDELSFDMVGITQGVTVNLEFGLAMGGGLLGLDQISGVENVTGSVLGDNLDGNAVGNVLWGIEGNDRLDGRAGNDELYGGDGNDTLIGGDGDDVLDGGRGRDSLDGGAGIDRLGFGFGSVGGAGAHGVIVDFSVGMTVIDDGFGNADQVKGFEQIDGSAFNDAITGGALNDTIWGAQGADSLVGGLGADVLVGEDGDDTLIGGVGDDLLIGGSGIDVLEGQSGTDTFFFDLATTATGIDVIRDFEHNIDWLNLSQFAPDLVLNSFLNAAQFTSGAGLAAATTAAQRVIYDTTSGVLYWDADGVGGQSATAFAQLTNHVALTVTDFWIN